MLEKDWLTCTVCDAEFKVVSPLDKTDIGYCPFCGSGVGNDFLDDEGYDDEDPTDNF